MISRKFKKLIEELKDVTARGKFAWHESAEEDTYLAALRRGIVEVAAGEGEGQRRLRVSLLDLFSNPLETLDVEDSDPDYHVIDELHELARKSAAGEVKPIQLDSGEKILNQMLDEIEALK
jgi:hypothetical protein